MKAAFVGARSVKEPGVERSILAVTKREPKMLKSLAELTRSIRVFETQLGVNTPVSIRWTTPLLTSLSPSDTAIPSTLKGLVNIVTVSSFKVIIVDATRSAAKNSPSSR
jgi:hypothetical protein